MHAAASTWRSKGQRPIRSLRAKPLTTLSALAFLAAPLLAAQSETLPWLSGDAAIPLALKIIYSIFVAALVPVYWRQYGLSNFLWFSDLSLFITLAAVWLESPSLASMQALSVG